MVQQHLQDFEAKAQFILRIIDVIFMSLSVAQVARS